MKIKISAFSFLMLSSMLFAENHISPIDELTGKMNLTIAIPDDSCIAPRVIQPEVPYLVGFSNDNRNIEYRINLVPDELVPRDFAECTSGTDMYFLVLSYLRGLAIKVSNDDEIELNGSSFNCNGAWKLFGGDAAFIVTSINGNSEFSRGFRFINISAVYKKNSGILIIYELYNDQEYYLAKAKDNIDSFLCVQFKK